jgi:carboxyl-terminal processing protease
MRLFRCYLLLSVLLQLGYAVRAELPPDQRQAIFRQVWGDVRHWYPSFGEKGVDWRQVRAEFAPRVGATTSDQQFYELMAEMLLRLRDGHTHVVSFPDTSPPRGMPAVQVAETAEGQLAIARVEPWGKAVREGVTAGMVITAVDGQPVASRLAGLMPRMIASTPHAARAMAIRHLLIGRRESPAQVTFADGTTRALTREAYSPWAPESQVSWRRLAGNLGYLRIPRWTNGLRIVEDTNRALEALKDTDGLIIDVRDNSGGNDFNACKVVARFITRMTPVATIVQRGSLGIVSATTPRLTRWMTPRGRWPYTRPVVLLTNPLVFSAGEFFTAAMKDTGRARTIGDTTAGSSGRPIWRRAGPLRYRISTWREYRLTGQLIEGHGIEPDLRVLPTVEDLRTGRDVVLERAMQEVRSAECGVRSGEPNHPTPTAPETGECSGGICPLPRGEKGY